MKYSIRSSFILLFLTMLLFSACRTAHSAAKEESATQTTETSQSSVASKSSFASLFSALSLRADSIVLWLQDGETVPTATSSEESGQFLSGYPNYCSPDSGFTAQSPNSPLPSARPSLRGRTIGKVLIGGVKLESTSSAQNNRAILARDSISTRENKDTAMAESEESKPPNLWHLLIKYALIYAFLGLAITFMILAVRSAFKIK